MSNLKYFLAAIIVLTVFVQMSFAWEKQYFSSYGSINKMLKLNNDEYVLVGYLSNNAEDALLLKINGNGDTLWTKTYNITYVPSPCSDYSMERAYDVIKTYDNNFLLGGVYHSPSRCPTSEFNNMFLIKTDTAGNMLWSGVYDTIFDAGWGFKISEFPDTTYTILTLSYVLSLNNRYEKIKTKKLPYYNTGSMKLSDNLFFISSMVLHKIDKTGNLLWYKFYPSSFLGALSGVCKASDNCYVYCGYESADTNRFYVSSTDSSGNLLWEKKSIGGNQDGKAYSMINTSDGNFLAVGYSGDATNFDQDIFLVKFGYNGDTLWTKRIGNNGTNEIGYCVVETDDGGYIIGGSSNDYVYIVKTDGQGNAIKEIKYVVNSTGEKRDAYNCPMHLNEAEQYFKKYKLSIYDGKGKLISNIKEQSSGVYYFKMENGLFPLLILK